MNKKLISNSNYVLRKVVNSEECLDIFKDLIESILCIKINEIELNPYLEKKSKNLPKEENFGIGDVRIKTSENQEMNVGIQFVDGLYYIQTKMLLYYAQIHLNQTEYDKKREFAKTITINFVDSIIFSSNNYYNTIKIKSNESNICMEELELHVVELPKFSLETMEKMNKREEWITYLKGCEDFTLEIIKKNNKNIALLDKLVEDYWHTEKME